MPLKYLVEEAADTDVEASLKKFDSEMGIKVPTILLERLKKEFDVSNDQFKAPHVVSNKRI
jgi:hypothetical protein